MIGKYVYQDIELNEIIDNSYPSVANRIPHYQYEDLNISLLSLTTHFAQVQLRLKQVLQSNLEDRESLLKELEEFAFKGCIDDTFSSFQDARHSSECHDYLTQIGSNDHDNICNNENHKTPLSQSSPFSPKNDNALLEKKERHIHLINQLKKQLRELEVLAYQTGTCNNLPQEEIINRQQNVLEEVNGNLKIDYNLDKMSPLEIKESISTAFESIKTPFKLQDRLCRQLKSQILDLERYIGYLHSEEAQSDYKKQRPCICVCPRHFQEGKRSTSHYSKHEFESYHTTSSSLLYKAFNMLGLFLLSFLDCDADKRYRAAQGFYTNFRETYVNGNNNYNHFNKDDLNTELFNKNVLVMLPTLMNKSVPQGAHWGNARANLEIAISNLINTCRMRRVRSQHYVRKKSIEAAYEEKSRLLGQSNLKIDPKSAVSPHSCATSRSAYLTSTKFDDDDEESQYNSADLESSCTNSSDPEEYQADQVFIDPSHLFNDSMFGEMFPDEETEEDTRTMDISRDYKSIWKCVNDELAPRLLDLLHHGFIEVNLKESKMSSSSIISYITCFSTRSTILPSDIDYNDQPQEDNEYDENDYEKNPLLTTSSSTLKSNGKGKNTSTSSFKPNWNDKKPHFWDALIYYYEIKNGPEYIKSSTKLLSQSFDLDIVETTIITPKFKLLSTIYDIICSYQPIKFCHKNILYRDFVRRALNQKHLVQWLRLVLKSKRVCTKFYQTWSYVNKTGFDDAFESLKKLEEFNFNLHNGFGSNYNSR